MVTSDAATKPHCLLALTSGFAFLNIKKASTHIRAAKPNNSADDQKLTRGWKRVTFKIMNDSTSNEIDLKIFMAVSFRGEK